MNESVDVEKLLKRWRDLSSYFKEASSWDEVFDKERVLFVALPPIVEWSTRSKHLRRLLNREEMGLTQSVIDSRLIELEEADTYEESITVFQKILRLAAIKGLSFKKVPAVRHLAPKKAPSPPREASIKGESLPKPMTVWFSYCKRGGHSVSECRSISRTAKPSASFKCGDVCHWAPNCPKDHFSTQRSEKQPIRPVEKQVQLTKSPKGNMTGPTQKNFQVTRFGRQIKPVQPRSLHTVLNDQCDGTSVETETPSFAAAPGVCLNTQPVSDEF